MARLYKDGPLFEILWYPARNDVPFKRGPNAISSNQWQADRPDEYDQVEVGEDPEYPRVFKYAPVNPLAVGGHVCGTPADWAGDGVYDPEPPYVEYRPDGLPYCCGALLASTGGLVIGGEAYIPVPKVGTGGLVIGGTAEVISPRIGTGGLVIGGTAIVSWSGGLRAGYGGLVIGGSALVADTGGLRAGYGGLVIGGTAIVTTGKPGPNHCDNAYPLALGQTLPYDVSPGEWWYYLGTLTAGEIYTIHRFVSAPQSLGVTVYFGTSCSTLYAIPLDYPCAYQGQWIQPVTAPVWISFNSDQSIPHDQTFEVLHHTAIC